jgi:flagellar biosynthetic protein FliQ
MSDLFVIDIGRQALWLLLVISGPVLIAALVVGVVISIFQAATQINEMTMTFIPKLLASGAVLLYMLPTIIHLFVDFFNQLMAKIPHLIP